MYIEDMVGYYKGGVQWYVKYGSPLLFYMFAQFIARNQYRGMRLPNTRTRNFDTTKNFRMVLSISDIIQGQ